MYFKINNKEIQTKKIEFFDTAGIKFIPKWDLIIFEGNYERQLENKEPIFRLNFTHRVPNQIELQSAINSMIDKLQHYILPIESDLMSVAGLDRFLNNDPHYVIHNIDMDILSTSLIAAWMNNNHNYLEIHQYFEKELAVLAKKGQYYQDFYDANKLLYQYLWDRNSFTPPQPKIEQQRKPKFSIIQLDPK